MSDSYEYEDRGRSSERWGGRTWTLIAALIVVVIIAGAAVWLVTRDDDDDGGDAASTSTAAAPTPTVPAGSLPVVEQLPDGFVGGREVVDGVPVGFPHSEAGAISAGAVWASHMFICPLDYRPVDGLAHIMAAEARQLTPCGNETSVSGGAPVAVRGTVSGDSGVLEYLLLGSNDFSPDSGWLGELEIITLTLTWSPDVGDWRITTWGWRSLFDSEAPPLTPDLLAGFQWLHPIGVTLTATPFVSGT